LDQVPVPSAVSGTRDSRDNVLQRPSASVAFADSYAGLVFPVIEVDRSPFKEVEPVSAIGARILLDQRAQNKLLLFLDRRQSPLLSRQQFRVLHVFVSTTDGREPLSQPSIRHETSANLALSLWLWGGGQRQARESAALGGKIGLSFQWMRPVWRGVVKQTNAPYLQLAMVKTLYFDESGFTGYNLLDPAQPIFTVASSDVDEQLALDILRDAFPRYQGPEYKFTNIWSSGNREGLRKFSMRLSDLGQSAFVYMVDKRFGVLTKIVDFLVEPIITRAGFDFYDEGFCWKYANYIHFGLTQVVSPELYLALTNAYQSFSRDPNEATLHQLQWHLGAMETSAD
jgi:hypothetical protein